MWSIIGNKKICQLDYNFIWTLSKCKCPNIRLYILDDVTSYYLRIRNLYRSDKLRIKLFLQEVEDTIDEVNQIFQSMVAQTLVCFENNSVNVDEIIQSGLQDRYEYRKRAILQSIKSESNSGKPDYLSDKYTQSMIKVVPEGKIKLKSKENACELKKVFSFLPNEGSATMEKVTYAVVTALNERWNK